VIDKLGFSYAQWRVVVLAGGLWIADGAELLVINTVSKVVGEEWDLSGTARGSIASSVWLGMCLGSLLSGEVGDVYGRRLPIIASYASIAVLSFLSVYSTGLYSLLVFRVLIGAAIGYGQPSGYSFSLEVTPSHLRPLVCSVIGCFFSLGSIFAASFLYLDDPSMQHIHWRWLVIAAATPSVLLAALAAALLRESPVFLAAVGRTDEAQEILADMRRQNGLPESESIDCHKVCFLVTPRVHAVTRYDVILGPSMLRTTVICCCTCFTMNLCMHGGLYAFAQILPELHTTSGTSSPAGQLLMGIICELPGQVIAYLTMQHLTRKRSIQLALTGLIFFQILFLYAAEHLHGNCALCDSLVHVGFDGLRLCNAASFIITYCYVSEVFPTKARATGSGLCFGIGRLASALGPLAYEWAASFTGHSLTFVYLMTFCAGMNLILSCFLEVETAGKALKELEDESEPLKA